MTQKYEDIIARISTATEDSYYVENDDIETIVNYIEELEDELKELQKEYNSYKDKVERYEARSGNNVMAGFLY